MERHRRDIDRSAAMSFDSSGHASDYCHVLTSLGLLVQIRFISGRSQYLRLYGLAYRVECQDD
jgi:hypothetical protein